MRFVASSIGKKKGKDRQKAVAQAALFQERKKRKGRKGRKRENSARFMI